MPSTRIAFIGFFLFLGSCVSEISAQEIQEDIADSEFSKIAEEMSNLIQFAEVDGELTVLKDWDKKQRRENAGQSKEEQLEKLIAEQVERGLPEDFAERHAKRLMERGNNQPAVRHQFEKIQKLIGRGSSGGGGGGGGNWHWRFDSGTFSGNLNTSPDRLSIRFADNGFGVSMELIETEGEKLQFRLSSDTGIVLLDQKENRIRLAVIDGDKAVVHIADDYQQLKQEHPAEVRKYLYTIWESLGVQRPLSISDPAVVEAALDKVRAVEGDGMEVYELLEALAGDSISARDTAEKSLTENFYKWSDLVAKYEGEFEFDERATKRMNRIRDGHPATPIQDYVNSIDLNDKDLLIQLWENAPEEYHRIIVDRLTSSTGLSLGNDIQAWKDSEDSSDSPSDK